MKLVAEDIRDLVEKNLDDNRLFVVDIKVSHSGDAGKIKIILDGDEGITIDQCADVSRNLSLILDEKLETKAPYVLEVTSPGLDHPITLFRQYVKNVGRKVKVVMKDHSEAKGVLKSVNENSIQIEKEKKFKKNNKKQDVDEVVEIPFNKIEKTKIQISFK